MSLDSKLFPDGIKAGDVLRYRGRRVGLFACFLEVIGLADACERLDIQFQVDIALGMYSRMNHAKGTNWWEYYFEPIREKKKGKEYNFNRKSCIHALHACYKLSIERRKELIKRYVAPLPDVQNDIDDFTKKYDLSNRYAMHYRATDKVSEGAILFPAEYAIEKINKIHDGEDWKLFLATDSDKFLRIMVDRLGEDRVCYTEATRSTNHRPVHVANKAGRQVAIGREAVVDCYLLASCQRFFGTTSNLSTAAKLLSNQDEEDFVHMTLTYKADQEEWRIAQKRKTMDILETFGMDESHLIGFKWLMEDGGMIV